MDKQISELTTHPHTMVMKLKLTLNDLSVPAAIITPVVFTEHLLANDLKKRTVHKIQTKLQIKDSKVVFVTAS